MNDVLIVCSREELREQLSTALQNGGYDAVATADAVTGQERWLKEQQPVLLLDREAFSTPGMAWLTEQAVSSRLLLLQEEDAPELASRYLYTRLSNIIRLPVEEEQLLLYTGSALKLARAVAPLKEQTAITVTPPDEEQVSRFDQELVDVILNAKREWQSIFDSFQDLILVVDREGQVQRLNLAVQHIYQEPFTRLIGSRVAPEIQRIIASGEQEAVYPLQDFRLLDRDQQVEGRWEFTVLPLRIGDRQDTLLLSGRDVTERERLRQRQEQMELELMQEARLSSVGMLASGLAHNMSTPVQCILGYSQALHHEYPDDERVFRLEKMSLNLKEIIENLMFKLRRDQTTEESLIDLNQLLQDDMKFLEADLYYKHQIEKEFHFAEQLPLVRGGHGDFSQAILNIVSNAVDAMYERPRRLLTIRTAHRGDKVLVSIADSGCGMTPEIRDNIFSPFFTTKPARDARQEDEPTGTGLGLASSRNLLDRYKVTIQVESTPDEGSCFTLLFPVAT